jgi:hypothetical protein
MDPHARLLHPWWIGDEDETIAFLEATDDGSAGGEHGAVHRRLESRGVGQDCGHGDSPRRVAIGAPA